MLVEGAESVESAESCRNVFGVNNAKDCMVLSFVVHLTVYTLCKTIVHPKQEKERTPAVF